MAGNCGPAAEFRRCAPIASNISTRCAKRARDRPMTVPRSTGSRTPTRTRNTLDVKCRTDPTRPPVRTSRLCGGTAPLAAITRSALNQSPHSLAVRTISTDLSVGNVAVAAIRFATGASWRRRIALIWHAFIGLAGGARREVRPTENHAEPRACAPTARSSICHEAGRLKTGIRIIARSPSRRYAVAAVPARRIAQWGSCGSRSD